MVKTLLSFGVLVSVLAVVVVVSPYAFQVKKGGVNAYFEEGHGKPYGPDIPVNYVNSYTEPVIKPVVLPEATEDPNARVYVYSSDNQTNYHLPKCAFAYATGRKMTLYEAYYMNKTPGKCCDAPAYTGEW